MNDYRAYARRAARRVGIDPEIFVRQIEQESGFNPNAISPAGARGIAQFMPGTAKAAGIDPMDPEASLDAAALLMAQRLEQYGGRWDLALAAYNAGAGAVAKYEGVPPYEETQQYIQAILGPTGAGLGAGAGVLPSTGPQGRPDQGGTNVVAPRHATYEGGTIAGLGSAGPVQSDPRLDELFRIKGNPVSVRRVSGDIEGTDYLGEPTTSPNPEPAYEYGWADGTSVRVTGNQESGYTITGTALKDLTEEATAKSTAPQTIKYPDGSLRQWNPATRQWDLLQTSPVEQTQPKYQMGSGATGQRQISVFDPTTGEMKWVANPNYIPPQNAKQTMISNYWATLDDIEQGMRSGRMDAATANRLMEMARQSLEAEMRGTTQFQMEQAKLADEQERRTLAGELIGQRLSSANSLAGSLTSSAFGLAQKAMMPPGKTSMGLNPLTWAGDYTAQQGGNELSALAQALLSGASGGGGPQNEDEYQTMMAQLTGQGVK